MRRATWLTLFVCLACGRPPREDGDAEAETGSETTTAGGPREACTQLCAKIDACVEALPATGCDWQVAGDLDACASRCDLEPSEGATARCIDCVGQRLVCTGSAALRPCDADCTGTPFVTGIDFEGAAEYDYTQYFCE